MFSHFNVIKPYCFFVYLLLAVALQASDDNSSAIVNEFNKAIKDNNVEKVKNLLTSHDNPNLLLAKELKYTILMTAVRVDDPNIDIVKVVLNHPDTRVNEKSKNSKSTALHIIVNKYLGGKKQSYSSKSKKPTLHRRNSSIVIGDRNKSLEEAKKEEKEIAQKRKAQKEKALAIIKLLIADPRTNPNMKNISEKKASDLVSPKLEKLNDKPLTLLNEKEPKKKKTKKTKKEELEGLKNLLLQAEKDYATRQKLVQYAENNKLNEIKKIFGDTENAPMNDGNKKERPSHLVNGRNKDNFTMHMMASRHGHIDIVKHLEPQADLSLTGSKVGNNSLMFACRYGHVGIVRHLAPLYKQKNIINKQSVKYGYSALHLTTIGEKQESDEEKKKNYNDIAKILIDNGIDRNLKTNNNNNALKLAKGEELKETLRTYKVIKKDKSHRDKTIDNIDNNDKLPKPFTRKPPSSPNTLRLFIIIFLISSSIVTVFVYFWPSISEKIKQYQEKAKERQASRKDALQRKKMEKEHKKKTKASMETPRQAKRRPMKD